MIHGSFFTGYGGLDMAVESVFGAITAWVSDIDGGACKVLAHRYPHTPNLGDVTAIDWTAVDPVDIISGGTPCQDLSHAGKRGGMTEGSRSNLWVTMREGIAHLRPSYVVWENVRGAYSAAADSEVESCPGCVGDRSDVHLRALGRVLGDLADLGYDVRWHGLRAADVGAPHGRFRVFVVAEPANVGHERGRIPRRRRAGPADGGGGAVALLPTPRATDGTKGGPNQRGSSGDMMLPSAVQLLPTPTSRDEAASGGSDPSTVTLTDAVVRTEMGTRDNPRLLPTPMVGSTDPAAHGQISGQYRDQMADALANWGKYADVITRWEHLTRPAPAPTEPGRNGNPRLSPAFTEWLMGLPAGWITDVPGITRNEALRLAGNGVVPQQAEAALLFLLNLKAVRL